MLETLYKDVKGHMRKSVEAITREFGSVRTGKASVHLLDTVKVEAYETVMPLNQVATVAAPEPRLLVVQPFDKSTVGNIVKAIQKADLGLNPLVEGHFIRVPVPALNEERRRELVKHCKHIAEEGRVAIRNIRRDANERLKKAFKDKQVSEDDEKEGLEEIQKITNDTIKEIDILLARKETEVMEV
jgi:ribosome recycling factor